MMKSVLSQGWRGLLLAHGAVLISAGVASSRAEAVRWALARIRERPAYEQLRARTREIEELKSQF